MFGITLLLPVYQIEKIPLWGWLDACIKEPLEVQLIVYHSTCIGAHLILICVWYTYWVLVYAPATKHTSICARAIFFSVKPVVRKKSSHSI